MRWLLAIAGVAGPSVAAQAQAPAEFYKGKQVSIYVGFSAGGSYDVYARALARHIGKHIPGNPTVVPRNMEGAGSLRLANFIYQVAPRDGTAIATIGRASVLAPLFGHRRRRSSIRASSPGSAAPTTKSASAPPGTRRASRASTIS